MPRMTPVVDLVYFNAGGGHRAAAQALAEVLQRQKRPWLVRQVNLTEVIDPARRFQRWTGMAPEDLYNARLRRGWTLGMGTELKLLQAGIRLLHAPLCRRLARHWAATQPDLVVSLIPNFNRAMGMALKTARPGVPFVTVMTDVADLPPHFWIEPDIEQHLVCGSSRAVQQALGAGVACERIHHVSVMLLRPGFYDVEPLDRAAGRSALGLDPGRPVAAVMYGGHGSSEMLRIARALPHLQLILFTGHNRPLAARLQRTTTGAARAVVGFTPDVPELLSLADFFIGKPGPGCLSEALRLGLPVITFDTPWTMPQEHFNTQWVRDAGLGIVLRSMHDLPEAVEEMTTRIEPFRRRVQALDNRAVFEVPELMAELLRGAAQHHARPLRGLSPLGSLPAGA